MTKYKDYLDELFIDKLGYEPDFQLLSKPEIEGVENLIALSRDYVAGNVSVIVADCKDRLPVFQKQLIQEYKKTYPDAHFLFISNNGKVFDIYNYATSKKLKPISYNEIERNTKLFKEKIQFFNASSVEGSAELKIQIDKAFETNDKITKKFYDNFKGIHDKLTNAITGIEYEHDKRWYATTLLNRIMFIFFLQKNYVLQNDTEFLITKFNQVREIGKDYFKDFLLPLFFNGFAKKDHDPEKKKFIAEYGHVKYLNGGLFYPNKIELKYAAIAEDIVSGVKVYLPDGTQPLILVDQNILNEVITFFNGYTWYLDNRPTKSEKEINPDVLGYIFEKYINQKELGAYYTKEDITEYISKNTIIPFICDKLRSNGFEAPQTTTVIVNNEDIKGLIDNFISNCNDYNTLKFLYKDILQNLSVLDPSVGSGAFLFAALNILLPIYQTTVARLKTYKGKIQDGWLTLFLQSLANHPEEYYLTKQIILNNLYGVDIVEEGVEICKLRLFLQLASHLADIKSIEPLPDIDFNIYAGNSLVGGLNWADLQNNYALQLFKRDGTKLDEDILLQQITALKNEKNQYKLIQSVETTEEQQLKQQKESIQFLENQINNAINIEIDNPFHWFVEFAEIFERGGFDVIIGNPPYVEYSKVRKEYLIKGYECESCGNLYTFFIERAIKISNSESYWGFIVQQSLVCTDRMIPIQKIIKKKSSNIFISNFDDRPGKLFDGLEHIRVTIVIAKNGNTLKKIHTTKYNRWYSNERGVLFNSIKYIANNIFNIEGTIPKIGNEIEIKILNKILPLKKIADLAIDKYGSIVYFHNAPQYWIRCTDYVPYSWTEKVGEKKSTHVKELKVNQNFYYQILGLLNSSLFYWWFIITSDCRDLNLREIQNFPIGDSFLDNKIIKELCVELMNNFRTNANRKTTKYKSTGVVIYDEYFPRYGKSIIDKIDDEMAKHYGLSNEESEFIKNYDLRFRMGNDDE